MKLFQVGDFNLVEFHRSETSVATWTHYSTKEEEKREKSSESSKKKREANGKAFRPKIEKQHEGSR